MARLLVLASTDLSLVHFRGALIRAIHKRGHTVVVAAPNFSLQVRAAILAIGAEPREIQMFRGGLSPREDIVTFRSLRKLLDEVKPEVIIPYTIKPVIWGTLAARAAGVKRIVPLITGLGYAFTGGREPKRLLARAAATVLYRLALRRADIVLFQNSDDMALFRKLRLLSRRVPSAVVNGSGIDLAHFTPAPLPKTLSFLMITRLLRDKGVREFGEATRMVKARHPHVAIRLVGYIDQSPDSITPVEMDAIVASGVEFVGRLDDVRPAIAQSSVYVLPSYREGTPRSTLEAMAMGRAIITTDAPGCRETVIERVNGFLVPLRDAVALATAMERFITNPDLARRMGAESRRIAEEKYDVDLVNAEIIRHAGL